MLCILVFVTSVLLARIHPIHTWINASRRPASALTVVIASVQTVSATEEGDPIRGKQLFEKRCTGCHALTQDREGPRLQGVFGRISGVVPGFTYSTALKNAKVVWNEATLDRWLSNPDAMIPGNNMDFFVAKQQERIDLIRFLKQAADK